VADGAVALHNKRLRHAGNAPVDSGAAPPVVADDSVRVTFFLDEPKSVGDIVFVGDSEQPHALGRKFLVPGKPHQQVILVVAWNAPRSKDRNYAHTPLP